MSSTFWGPMYPDSRRPTRLDPPTFAELSLAPTQTNSGALDNVRLRARVGGTYGNGITVQFTADALTDEGELIEDVGAKTVHVKFAGDSSDVDNLYTLLAVSELVEMVGTWRPSDVLASGDDEFGATSLTGGVDQQYHVSTFWGPHYPDKPATVTLNVVPSLPPIGAATLALALENGAQITYEWVTSAVKKYDGSEQRMATIDAPRQTLRGSAYLVGEDVAAVRAQLESFAASGSAFLLALPHLELTVTGPMVGEVLPVTGTALSDWVNPGQRVLVVSPTEGEKFEQTIQDSNTTSITINSNIPSCDEHWRVMPLIAVYLEPQQGFARFADDGVQEQWQITARAAVSWFESNAVPATLDLYPLASSGALENVQLAARTPGAFGNGITIEFEEGNFPDHGVIQSETITPTGGSLLIGFLGTVTTTKDIEDLIDGHSQLVRVSRRSDNDFEHLGFDDAFSPTALAGGLDAAPGEMGRGATLTTFDGMPVFDRGIPIEGSANDSMHSLVDLQDLGAEPFAAATAAKPDWGRFVATSRSEPSEFQWLMKFLGEARGRARTWWLSSWRRDLTAVGDQPQLPPGSFLPPFREMDLTVVGGVAPWYPDRTSSLEFEQVDGTLALARITNATDNGDGTTTLRVQADPADGAARLPGPAEIVRISWLDLCHFESDQITVAFRDAVHAMTSTARVVRG